MASTLRVVEHFIPGQYIREYPNATRHRQEDVLQLAIKQYIPVNNPDPLPDNAITIIGVQGLASPKVQLDLTRFRKIESD